jgi:hypothetical protein
MISATTVCRLKHLYAGRTDMSGKKQRYRLKRFTVGAGQSRLYGSSPQAKVTCEDLQISLTRRRMSAGLSSCVECRVGSMAPLI